jgi:hypothetical protein
MVNSVSLSRVKEQRRKQARCRYPFQNTKEKAAVDSAAFDESITRTIIRLRYIDRLMHLINSNAVFFDIVVRRQQM